MLYLLNMVIFPGKLLVFQNISPIDPARTTPGIGIGKLSGSQSTGPHIWSCSGNCWVQDVEYWLINPFGEIIIFHVLNYGHLGMISLKLIIISSEGEQWGRYNLPRYQPRIDRISVSGGRFFLYGPTAAGWCPKRFVEPKGGNTVSFVSDTMPHKNTNEGKYLAGHKIR